MDNELAKRFIAGLSPDDGEIEALFSQIDKLGSPVLYDMEAANYSNPLFDSKLARLKEESNFDEMNYSALKGVANHVEYSGSYGLNDHMTNNFEEQGFKVLYNLLVPYTIPDESHHAKNGDDPKLHLNIMLEDKNGKLYLIQRENIDSDTPVYVGSYEVVEVEVAKEDKAAFVREQAGRSLSKAYASERLDAFILLFELMDLSGINVKKIIDENMHWLPKGLLTILNVAMDITDATPSMVLVDGADHIRWEITPSNPNHINLEVQTQGGNTQHYVLVDGSFYQDNEVIYATDGALIDVYRPEALEIKIKEAQLLSGQNHGIITDAKPRKANKLEANITTSP